MWADLLDEFLEQGQWSVTADDNANGETLTQDFLRRLVNTYAERPDDQEGKRALGLFVLALGVAEWGVRDPIGLEDKNTKGEPVDSDPARRQWASDSIGDSGKHLMAYSIGGIGISHADGSEFVDFVERIAAFSELSDDQRKELLHVIEPARYNNSKVVFDQLRASSVCRNNTPTLGNDLFGGPFRHHEIRGGTKYCSNHFGSPKLDPHDWIVFRTWARIAMRRRNIQELLLINWMEKYWDKSIGQMAADEGREEEAFINVRFRNSASGAANHFAAPIGTLVGERIARQMIRYREVSGDRVDRRVNIIQRPVVLYRKFLGKPPIQNFRFSKPLS